MKCIVVDRYIASGVTTLVKMMDLNESKLLSDLMHAVEVNDIMVEYEDFMVDMSMCDLEMIEEKVEELLESQPFNLKIATNKNVCGRVLEAPFRVSLTIR